MNKQLDSLEPSFKPLIVSLLAELKLRGINCIVTSGRRTIEEQNKLYAQVDRYFPVAILGTVASYPIVKPEFRPWLYGAITLLESVVIVSNFRNGLHMNFEALKF